MLGAEGSLIDMTSSYRGFKDQQLGRVEQVLKRLIDTDLDSELLSLIKIER